MTSLQLLMQRTPEVFSEYFAACRAAEESRDAEKNAVVAIQKYARGFLTRRRIDHLRWKVVTIQRCWRGYLGRQRALLAREARDKRLREAYFAAMATVIQRHWRGFWSRKHIFDFHARKQYLARVADLNTKMRAVLAEEGDRAAHAQKALAEAAAKAAFDERVSKLHHLLSTSTQPGIFASPYAVAAGSVPVIAGLPVEEHLRQAFKFKTGTLQSNTSQSSPSRTVGTFLPPIKSVQGGGDTVAEQAAGATGASKASFDQTRSSKGTGSVYDATVLLSGLGQVVPRHMTLRQSVPYDVLQQAAILEHKVNKAEMLSRHPYPFANSLRKPSAPLMTTQSNLNLEGYCDPYDPTIGQKTETFTPQQQRMSPSRFTKYPVHAKKQPYFDDRLMISADAFPPKTYVPITHTSRAAGLTNAEIRARAQKPARA